MAARLDVVEFQGQADRIINEVSRALVGKHDALRLALVAMAADGHILIEDLPGLGKTLMARSFASALGLDFKRVQFTPDLMPADITGTSIYNQASGGFEFRPGPVFTNLLLADEINRAPAKTQAALLEAMQERQVTIEGDRFQLPQPFMVLATQNPIDLEGTYPLPEAQIDRFLLHVPMGYPTHQEEVSMLEMYNGDPPVARSQLAVADLLELQSIASRSRAGVEKVRTGQALHHLPPPPPSRGAPAFTKSPPAGIALRAPAVVAWGGALILALALGRAATKLSVMRLRAAGLEMVWRA